MKRFSLAFLLLLATSLVASAAEPTAEQIMSAAYTKAQKEKKNVMVIFHASWCGWCKRLDSFLTTAPEGKLVSNSYVVVHLDVMENGDKKSLENAGGETLMSTWGGAQAGLPFTVVLSPAGKKLTDSNRPVEGKPGQNIGYPAAPEEIAHFMTILKATSKLNAANLVSVEKWLKENAPKQ